MENITACLEQVNLFLWNGPLLFLLSAAHLFFSCKFFPQKYIGKAIRLSLRPEKNALREKNAAVPDRQPSVVFDEICVIVYNSHPMCTPDTVLTVLPLLPPPLPPLLAPEILWAFPPLSPSEDRAPCSGAF